MRPIERELYEPQGKVSRVPDEWKNGNVKHVYDIDEVDEKEEDVLF